jgi:hypothetical protein
MRFVPVEWVLVMVLRIAPSRSKDLRLEFGEFGGGGRMASWGRDRVNDDDSDDDVRFPHFGVFPLQYFREVIL